MAPPLRGRLPGINQASVALVTVSLYRAPHPRQAIARSTSRATRDSPRRPHPDHHVAHSGRECWLRPAPALPSWAEIGWGGIERAPPDLESGSGSSR